MRRTPIRVLLFKLKAYTCCHVMCASSLKTHVYMKVAHASLLNEINFLHLFHFFFTNSCIFSLFSLFVQSLRSFVSRDNPIEIHKWWRRLSPMTHALIELAGFKNFVELHPTEFAKKFLLYALVERWWDTTHTLHIAGVEMMITPYNIHRLMGLRVDGLILTFNTFVHAFELIGSILDWIWERLQLISLAFFMPSWKLHETQRREGLGWRGPFSCT
jgi:hypothetical protein